MLAVGDTVVYPPHGPGVVVDSPGSSEQPMLTIRVARNNLTLSVPEALAQERGVRPTITTEQVDEVLAGMRSSSAQPLLETPQLRARAAVEVERSGDPFRLAAAIRDYDARERGGTKLTPPERKVLEGARTTLAAEIALVRDISIEEAEGLLDASLG